MIDPALRRLIDKDAIRDRLMLYSRGVDRHDRAALSSAYWPDALDDHISYVGDIEGFIDYSCAFTSEMRTQHLLGQMLIEFESDTIATSETYYIATHDMPTAVGRQDFTMKGRYLDRLEKRGDEWRIIHRILTCDLFEIRASTADWNSPIFKDLRTKGGRFPDDPLYTMLKG